jgi:hypothetical protein
MKSSSQNLNGLKLLALFIAGIVLIFMMRSWIGNNGQNQNQNHKSEKMSQ